MALGAFCLTVKRTNGKLGDSLQGGKVLCWTIFDIKKLLAKEALGNWLLVFGKISKPFKHKGHEGNTEEDPWILRQTRPDR